MYIEIHQWKDFEQKVLYFKLNNALNMNIDSELNLKFAGIYAIYKDNICLYVGHSKNLASRIATHIKGKYENFTDIYLWNIEEIGFPDFVERSLGSQESILTNSEKYLMTKLKPIENLDIDMDFKLQEIQTPSICFRSSCDFTITSYRGTLSIADISDSIVEDIILGVNDLNYTNKIDLATGDTILKLIEKCYNFKHFSTKGIEND
jgi:hypothetical protein